MPDVTIYGPPMSTFVRTARMACAEKGITHDVEQVDFRSEEFRRLHPFNRVPALRHGDFVLFETGAIARYVDRAFPGPSLQPRDLRALARMDQWLSAITDYVYDVMIRRVVWERIVIPMQGGQPDEAKIAAAVPELVRHVAILDTALKTARYLAGDDASLADLMLFPIIVYVRVTPEGQDALLRAPALGAWFERMAGRPSVAATDPSAG
jgi:glutathione S-transferase